MTRFIPERPGPSTGCSAVAVRRLGQLRRGQREARGVESRGTRRRGSLEADGGALGGRRAVELGEHAVPPSCVLAVEVEDHVVAEVLDQLDRGGQRGVAGGDDADVLGGGRRR